MTSRIIAITYAGTSPRFSYPSAVQGPYRFNSSDFGFKPTHVRIISTHMYDTGSSTGSLLLFSPQLTNGAPIVITENSNGGMTTFNELVYEMSAVDGANRFEFELTTNTGVAPTLSASFALTILCEVFVMEDEAEEYEPEEILPAPVKEKRKTDKEVASQRLYKSRTSFGAPM